ncbi:MAG: HEAT repeat domain-containing protein, partial [Chlamydiia bacterium]|nr:HEAT repeat domain-containing protein [Chlamydiia bacterium]
DRFATKIQCCLTLKDYAAAQQLIIEKRKSSGNSREVLEAEFRLLTATGPDLKIREAWSALNKSDPSCESRQELIEEMAWGIIKRGAAAPSPMTRGISLLAARLTEDSRGVSLIRNAMRKEEGTTKQIAVQMASSMPDLVLCDQMQRLMQEEGDKACRLLAIRGAGSMQNQGAIALVRERWRNSSDVTERMLALEALIELEESLSTKECEEAALSDRAEVRAMAARGLYLCRTLPSTKVVCKLVNDSCGTVRALALQSLLLTQEWRKFQSEYMRAVNDSQEEVAVSGALGLMACGDSRGESKMRALLQSEKQLTRLMAAGAVAWAGSVGQRLACEFFQRHSDPFVCLNLARGLISLGNRVEEASQVISQVLKTYPQRMGSLSKGALTVIVPASLANCDAEGQTQDVADQILRLELLNLVARSGGNEALEAMKEFLKRRNWGISATAAALLVTEGEPEAADLIRSILQDPSESDTLRVQAAIVLGLIDNDPVAYDFLELRYNGAPRVLKERILEAMIRSAPKKSIGFLIGCLNESSQHLRIVAAVALLKCMNH